MGTVVEFFMRIFFTTVLIFIFSLQFWTKADDISEFEIEGMSIGDSALDFFSHKQISKYVYDFKSDEFKSSDIHSSNFKTYDAIQINYKPNDKNYTIYGISGMIAYQNNIAECYKKQKEIIMDMKRDLKIMSIRDDGTYVILMIILEIVKLHLLIYFLKMVIMFRLNVIIGVRKAAIRIILELV